MLLLFSSLTSRPFERTCTCGTPMVVIGQDICEQLGIVPMQARVLRHIRMRYGAPAALPH